MAVIESLMDYKESMSSNDEGSRVSHSSGGGEEVSPKGSEDDCRKDERCRQEEGLSACVWRHALSKWCQVIEIASEVSRLVMSLDR